MDTIFRLEARWTGGTPPAAVGEALDALRRYDGDELMAAVRVLSPAAMHTGFLLHERRERCELLRVRRDDRLWILELRGACDGQSDVCDVLDFLDALGFRHVSVSGFDEVGDDQVLSATLWRQRFALSGDDDPAWPLTADDDSDDDDDDEEDGFDGDDDADGLAFADAGAFPDIDVDVGDEFMPDFGEPLDDDERAPIRAAFAALAAVDDGSVVAALATFAAVVERLRLRHGELSPAAAAVQGSFAALAAAHAATLDDDGLRPPLYAHFAGLAAQALQIERVGTLAMLLARAGQFSRVLHGLLDASAPSRPGDDRSGLVGIARAASGGVHLIDD